MNSPAEERTASLPMLPAAAHPRTLRTVLRRALLGISPEETSFARRRFRGDSAAVRERLEEVGRSFVRGYNAALEEDEPLSLAARLDAEVEPELRGLAYEGAGMAVALLDTLLPGRRDRLARFLETPQGQAHIYLIHVGAGWILARLPLSVERLLARLEHPLGRWLALDGYGFHEGFFRWPRSVEWREVPRKLHGYARRGFDQGLGRSLWFVDGADVRLIPRTIGAFPADRRPDLWSGVGLACAYAGGRGRAEIEALRRAAGPHAARLAQGVAFAAEARQRAGNLAEQTELACRVICGTDAAAAAAVIGETRHDLPPDRPGEPAFEVWRQRIQDHFQEGAPR